MAKRQNNSGDPQDFWFPFYHLRWLSSTRISKMRLEHQAVFLRILCNLEQYGELPYDSKLLASMLQVDRRTVATWLRLHSDIVATSPHNSDYFVCPKFSELSGKLEKRNGHFPLDKNRGEEKRGREDKNTEVVIVAPNGNLDSTGEGVKVEGERVVSTSSEKKETPADTLEETASVLKNEFYSYLGHRIAKRFLAVSEREKSEKCFLSLLESENATHIRNVMKYAFSGWWADTFKKANSPAEKFVEHFDTMAQQMVADSESQRGKRQGFSTIAGREGAGELFAEWEEDEEKEQAK
jgi:hypothetical protein